MLADTALNQTAADLGPNADEFVPERWIENEKMGQTLLSAGLLACIGYAFRSPHALTRFSPSAYFILCRLVRLIRWRILWMPIRAFLYDSC